jgi:hypothetical protein
MKVGRKVKMEMATLVIINILLLVVDITKEVVTVTRGTVSRLIMVLKVVRNADQLPLLFPRLHLIHLPLPLQGTDQGQIQALHRILEREEVIKRHMVLEAIKVTIMLRCIHLGPHPNVSFPRDMKMAMPLHTITMEDTLMHLPILILILRPMDVKSILWRLKMIIG